MKTKILVVTFFLCTVLTGKAFSFGLGAQFNFKAGEVFAPGAALLVSPTRTTNLAVNWYLDSNKVTTLGITFDILAIPRSPRGGLNFTLGGGVYGNTIFDDEIVVNGGVRLPVGLNVLLIRNVFEIFAHVAPSVGVSFIPSLEFTKPFFPVAVGARVWFN